MAVEKGEVTGHDSERRVNRAIEALLEGKGIVLTDDVNRENEGDLIFPASRMTVEQMALMVRVCSGIVCLCLTEQTASRLELPPMVENNTSRYGTAFTVSIDAADGVTTGVSAADRMATIRAVIAPEAVPADLNRPGHVFPLIARKGGVFERPGHTEGSVDLMKLACLPPFAVLCELTNEDGTMARWPEVTAFSRKHGFPIVTIDDIRTVRRKRETGPGLA